MKRGTADYGPEGVLRAHGGLVQGMGADEARVQLAEEAVKGPRAVVDGGVWEAEGVGVSRVHEDRWVMKKPRRRRVDLRGALGAE